MACNLTSDQIGEVVLTVVRAMNHNNKFIKPENIGSETSFDDDIRDDGNKKRLYRHPIQVLMDHHGCPLPATGDQFAACKKVKDMMKLCAE